MPRPPINDSLKGRYGTFHSMTVKRDDKGRYQALVRLCFLTEEGNWKWVNRRSDGQSFAEAATRVWTRVTADLQCATQAETNRRTNGWHRGHRHVSDEQRAQFSHAE